MAQTTQKQDANAYEICKHLMNQGMTKAAACGIIGNMMIESHLDPTISEIGSGSGYGLIQWTDLNHYPNNGKAYVQHLFRAYSIQDPYTSIVGQCKLLVLEVEATQSPAYFLPNRTLYGSASLDIQWSAFKKLTNVETACKAYLQGRERPSMDAYNATIGQRIEYAKHYYNNLNMDAPDPNQGQGSSGGDKASETNKTPQNQEVTEHWVEKVKTEIQKIKWSLDEGYYFVDGNTLRSSNSDFSMQRYGDTYLLFLDEQEKQVKYWEKQQADHKEQQNNQKPSDQPSSGSEEHQNQQQEVVNQFINRAKSMLNKGVKYAWDAPRNPENGSTDCSGFVTWAVKPWHPSVYLQSTVGIHSIFSANGYVIARGKWSQISSKLKAGDIINCGSPSLEQSAGGAGHVIIALGNDECIECTPWQTGQVWLSAGAGEGIRISKLSANHCLTYPDCEIIRIYK